MIEIPGRYTTARVMIDELDDMTAGQITQFVNHPAFTSPVAIMPDTHAGIGSVIGFTMPLTDKVIPNVVGVDIGCGMLSLNFGKELPISLELLDRRIRDRVPFGQNVHDKPAMKIESDFPWDNAQKLSEKFAQAFQREYGVRMDPPFYNMSWFEKSCSDMGVDMGRVIRSLGSLGGGNHFIETGVDLEGYHWVTIHTGSRNWGKQVCERWQKQAALGLIDQGKIDVPAEIERIKAETTDGKEIFRRIKELKARAFAHRKATKKLDLGGREWLEGDGAAGYLFDMIFSQVYASYNRTVIGSIIHLIVEESGGKDHIDQIETVHNFIDFNDFIIRKGAIRSYHGEKICIPLNMRDGILICEGKSNPEWNFSAPHGAGRSLSRNQAKKRLDLEEFKSQMEKVYSTSVCPGTLDEAPGAYKDASLIERAIGPTATVINRIKPVHNMKDSGEKSYRKKKGVQ